MRKKRDSKKEEKFTKEKIEKHIKKYPNGDAKKCLRCDKEFLSIDVCTNRICVDCSRVINKEWVPTVHKSGLNSSSEPDDWV